MGHRIKQKLLGEMTNSVLTADMQTIEKKHSGKYLSHFLYDVGMIEQLVSTGILNIMKDSITLIALAGLMFYQNWKLAIFSLIMMPLAAFVAKSLGKRMGKATVETAESTGTFSTLKLPPMLRVLSQSFFSIIHFTSIWQSLVHV